MHFVELKKIGIWDVNEMKIIGEIPASDAETLFAAGAKHLLTYSNKEGTLVRWNLATQAKELSKKIEYSKSSCSSVTSSASHGPAYTACNNNVAAESVKVIDLEKLDTKPIVLKENGFSRGFEKNSFSHISSQGNLVTIIVTGYSQKSLQTYVTKMQIGQVISRTIIKMSSILRPMVASC